MVEPLASEARKRKHVAGKATLIAWGSGGLVTAMERKRMGYAIDGVCALCGDAPDTPEHRWGRCKHPSVVKALVPLSQDGLNGAAQRF